MKLLSRTKLVVGVLFLLLLIACCSKNAYAANVITGDCGAEGSSVTYCLNLGTGKLTITGKGAIKKCKNKEGVIPEHRLDIKEVVIGEGVTEIGEFAFAYAENLTKVQLPTSLQSLKFACFINCKKLQAISIPDSVTSLGCSVFACCESLRSIKLPSKITIIPEEFLDGTGITSIDIPNSVTEIGPHAFRYTTALKTVKLPSGLRTLGYGAFSNSCLVSFEFPNCSCINQYSNSIFYHCESLKSCKFAEGTTLIPNKTFEGCKSLESVYIPNSVKTIGQYAFWNCIALKHISLPASLENIEQAGLMLCRGLEELNLPSSIKTLGFNSLAGVDNITFLEIPESLDMMNGFALTSMYNLETLLVDRHDDTNGVRVFESKQIDDCRKLKEIIIKDKSIELNNFIVFSNTDKEKITIIGYSGSTAQTFATTNEMSFVDITTINEKPQNLKVVVDDKKGITLSWDRLYYADEYTIYRKVEDGEYAKLCTLTDSSCKYFDKDITNNTTYEYRVTAKVDGGNESEATVSGPAYVLNLDQVTKVKAMNTEEGIKLTFNKVQYAKGYKIYRSFANNEPVVIGNVAGNTNTTYIDTKAGEGALYSYHIVAMNGDKKSAASDKATIRRMKETQIAQLNNKLSGIEIVWNKLNNIKTYNVYRKYRDNQAIYIATVTGNKYLDTKVVGGAQYWYYVVPLDEYGNKGLCSSGKTLVRLSRPTITSLSNLKNGIAVKYKAVAGATGYIIYRKYKNNEAICVGTVWGNTNTTFIDTKAGNAQYWYYVVAANGNSKSEISAGSVIRRNK